MLERAGREGRVVSIDQMINSDRGAAETVHGLWNEFGEDPRFRFHFVDNYGDAPQLSTVELAGPRKYTGIRERLNDILDTECGAGRITEDIRQRVRGRGERGKPDGGGPGGPGGGGGTPPSGTAETQTSAERSVTYLSDA